MALGAALIKQRGGGRRSPTETLHKRAPWESHFYEANRGFQQGIEAMSQYDVVVGIFPPRHNGCHLYKFRSKGAAKREDSGKVRTINYPAPRGGVLEHRTLAVFV